MTPSTSNLGETGHIAQNEEGISLTLLGAIQVSVAPNTKFNEPKLFLVHANKTERLFSTFVSLVLKP